MADIAIVTDSACDLAPQIVSQLRITIVPLIVRFGADTYLDGELSRDEFWDRAEAGPHPQTSQPPVGAFQEVFSRLVAAGKHVICPVISSKISGTYNSARIAAESFAGKVTVFDTGVWSLLQGYQVIKAARSAAAGLGIDSIVATLSEIRGRSHCFISVDTIDYLGRGGRAQRVMPALRRVVSALSIKPIIQLRDGEMHPFAAARSRLKAMRRITRELQKHVPAEALIVAHTRISDLAHEYARDLAEQFSFDQEKPMICELGPALASHAGPGAFAAGVIEAASS